MSEIIRNRTIRPSTRLASSKSYKINTEKVSSGDTLVVNINHESNPFCKSFKFNGKDIAHKKSISFRVNEFGSSICISWSGAKPIGSNLNATKFVTPKPTAKTKTVTSESKISSTNIKTSFDAVSNQETSVLILGTMPGDKSLDLGEYYGHSRNRFWKIISKITENDLPITYADKKSLLYKTKIGIWDIAHKVNRKGSLDSEIKNEEPNDLDNFITKHKKLKIIGFNGKKAEALFDKYFDRNKNIKYISLPSTSPANTSISYNDLCDKWGKILD